MVRLVFRPYTRLRRSICTSESLRTSTRVSPGFVLAGHRSPSFGSQHVRSGCACPDAGKPAPFANAPGMRRRDNRSHQATDLPSASTEASLCFHCALVFGGTETRAHVRLLGPCFKTGRMEPQPNSSQTQARAARQTTGSRNLRPGSTTGRAEPSNRIARLGTAAASAARRDAAQTASIGWRALEGQLSGGKQRLTRRA